MAPPKEETTAEETNETNSTTQIFSWEDCRRIIGRLSLPLTTPPPSSLTLAILQKPEPSMSSGATLQTVSATKPGPARSAPIMGRCQIMSPSNVSAGVLLPAVRHLHHPPLRPPALLQEGKPCSPIRLTINCSGMIGPMALSHQG